MTLPFPEEIESARLFLRRLRYEDAEEIFFAYASKPEATRFVSWSTHQRIADTREYLKHAVKAWRAGTEYAYAIRLKGTARLAGSIGVLIKNTEAQVGYIISPALWGNGFATEACTALSHVLRNMQTLTRVWTLVDAENTASLRVLQKCGWINEGIRPSYFVFVNQGSRAKDCFIFTLAHEAVRQ